mgnify:CR=1 FL=1
MRHRRRADEISPLPAAQSQGAEPDLVALVNPERLHQREVPLGLAVGLHAGYLPGVNILNGCNLKVHAGEFVGIIFDGNLESLPWDYAFDERQGRATAVHSAAILAALFFGGQRNRFASGQGRYMRPNMVAPAIIRMLSATSKNICHASPTES